MKDVSSRVASSSSHSSGSVSTLGSPRGGSIGIHTYQSMTATLHLRKSIILQVLGLNAFNHLWIGQASYVFPTPTLIPLVLSRFFSRTCQRSIQTSDSRCTLLEEDFLLPTVWKMFLISFL